MELTSVLARRNDRLSAIIQMLNESGAGIVILVDDERHVLGTITDGDVRRAILHDFDMSTTVEEVLLHKDVKASQIPVTAQVGTDEATILAMMAENRLHQIPLVDDEGRVVDLVLLDDLVLESEAELGAVLMAGGFGKRLMPMTASTPKPMLEIGGRPILERIIGQLRDSGIGRVSVTTHYRHDQIADHFGDGENFGVDIDYVREDNPLGTAGALSMIERPDTPVLVMNSDILTGLNFRMLGKFHSENKAVMTVAVRPYEHTVPYGVVETEGIVVKGVREKPKSRWMINAGIYILAPDAFNYIPHGEYFDMPSLMDRLIENGLNVVCFPLYEYWRDIGRPQDFEDAEKDVRNILGE